jgi:hypothetical protein
MNWFICWLIFCLFWFTPIAQAKPLAPDKVPESLKPWIDWVLQAHDYPERACPFLYNSFEQKYCSWVTDLNLDLQPTKGKFTSRVQVDKKDDWIELPGDDEHWPLSVTANGKTVLVMDKEGTPSIKLTTGTYQLQGEFLWDTLPDNLTLPDTMGLINLRINGQTFNMPTIKDGQLWLKDSERGETKPENVQNSINPQIFRKIIDDVPLQVLTHLDLEVSGEQREEKLTGMLLDGFIPIAIDSPLPSRLEADGKLTVQLRAGRWQIEVLARSNKEINQQTPLTLPKESNEEIWVFDARPELRVVEIASDTIDASQTNLPEEWRNLPAYRINPAQNFSFKVIRRGDPNPEPNRLNLTRKLWLDFDGAGYTINDRMVGKMTSGWRLNALPETELGRVTLDGDNQLITQQQGTQKKGVEVRKGMISLDADSRVTGDIAKLSAVGWEQSFHRVNAELYLPPGWRLLAASGVDNVPNSWIARWTLLDLFLVLMIAIATGKLWNRCWGMIALVTLAIIWHEANAPHFIWLHILAATALLSVLPQGKFFAAICWYRRGCWLVLAMITLPFMIDQVRIGLYPQLERPSQEIYQENQGVQRFAMTPPVLSKSAPMATLNAPIPYQAAKPAAPPPPANMDVQPEPAMPEAAVAGRSFQADDVDKKMEQTGAYPALRKQAQRRLETEMLQQSQSNVYYNQKSDFMRIDPKAKVQTGPGLPQWQWHSVNLSWNGAVDTGHQVHLWYLSPTMTMLLNFLRVILVALLALLMLGYADKILPPSLLNRCKLDDNMTPLVLCLLVLPLLCTPTQAVYADDYPSDALLEQLANKLQEQVIPDCLPSCAHIQQMTMSINDKDVQINLQIHAQESVVLPLPADYGQWFPNQVTDNSLPATALYRSDNSLWINLKSGEHQVILRGATPALSKFSLPLPLKPKRVVVEKTGWELVGLHEDGLADEQLQFSRVQQTQADKTKPVLEQGALPPFIRVERTVQLGVDWHVVTQITRLSPADSAVMLAVPLLKGESVTTEDIRVKDRIVEVNMAAQQTTMQWESNLERTDKIQLTAPDTTQWTEVWRVDVSPVWHIDSTGVAMMHLNSDQQWLPEWHPFANETVSLTITQPESVLGKTLTIDSSSLRITQGERMRDVLLKASLRSSQGMQQTLTLPENAQLQSVAINGKTQPLRLEGQKLTLPVNPGKQDISVTWQEAIGIHSLTRLSKVDLGADSVNSNLSLSLGQDRWVLFAFGPRFGPIILFWGVLVVIVLLSFGLGKIPLTPLKHWHWFLLLLGLSQIPLEAAAIVIAWLMVLGWRFGLSSEQPRYFNLLQVTIALLTLAALSVLCSAVAQGLLSSPDMQITGNHSSATMLNWYQDRSASTLPNASVFSLPLLVYRLLMLAWSLWLASALLNWLRWGWSCFASNGLWHKKLKVTVTKDEELKT